MNGNQNEVNQQSEINTSSQPQNTQITENNIPEMSSQSQNIPNNNPPENSQIQNNQPQTGQQNNQLQSGQQINQPQTGQQINQLQPGQQINQPQSGQAQPIPQVMPQIPPEKKVIFLHPMNNYCSPEKIKEIETCPPHNIFQIVRKRFDDIAYKLLAILKNHEKYTLFGLYYKLLNNFLMNRQYGKDPQTLFQKKDPSLRLKISDFDFVDVLNNLGCQLTTEEISLILKSLTQKTSTLYSYDEFLKNVYNVQANEKGQMRVFYQQCSYYFNDYLYSFRHYIQDNKIDYKNAFLRACSGVTTLTFDLFQKFLNEIGFKIGHDQEIQYLFCALCDSNYFADHIEIKTGSYILQKTLFEMAELNDMSEEDFNKSGIVSNEVIKKNTDWIKNITNYTEATRELYKKNFGSFESTFKGIHEKCIRYNIDNLTTYFAESNEDISPEGDIDIEDFKKLMSNIGVSYNVQFDTLITQFKDNKKKPKNVLKLVEFLSIYNLFIEDDKVNISKNGEIKFGEENLKATENINENVNYIYKNAHRKFTQEDIDCVSDFCDGIADIIIEELHDSVTNFFQKKHKLKGYFFLDEFKDILENDLKISLEGTDEDKESVNIFLDFVTSDQMVEGSDIVDIKKLIHIITFYSGKDEPQKPNNNNIDNSNQNNKIKFDMEGELKPTNVPNINNEKKISEQNANLHNEINTDTHNVNNIIDNSKNKKIITEIINTDINTSSISFDKIISDFAHFLYNNRIRFNNVFPSINLEKIINNQTISDDTLRLGFQNANFEITDQEFSVLMTHFDPINKNKVFVEDLKHEIAKYEPKYFNQSYQKIDPDVIKAKLQEKQFSSSGTFTRDSTKVNLLNGMYKIQTFLDKNKITPENFFFGRFCKKIEMKIYKLMKNNGRTLLFHKIKQNQI